MKQRQRLSYVICLFLWASSVSANESRWATVTACMDLTPDSARLECFDQAVQSANVPSVTQSSTDTNTAQAVSDATTLFGRSDADVRKELQLAPPTALPAVVAKVARNAYKKLEIGLENGQRWYQLDNNYLNLTPGDQVTIARALAGSYLLRKTSGGRSIRVKRVDLAKNR